MAEGGYIDVKCRVKGVLEKLKDCFGELHGIVTDGSSEERSDLVSTVREVLGALETGLKSVAENQEESESRSKRMRSRRLGDPGMCTHSCVHHPEIVNPGLWRKLTEHLVALVFARLPVPRIVELRKSSAAWAALSDSASFKGAFAEANPKLFGLLGWGSNVENFRTRILDASFTEWHSIDLDFLEANGYIAPFPQGNVRYACDGGLVCLVCPVPESEDDECEDDECSGCVLVCNPLTNAWRKLPDPWEICPFPFPFRDVVLVQLVTSELSYRVILVYRQDGHMCTSGAFVYDSRAGSWSLMSAGLVYGTGNLLMAERSDPLVFDCATERFINLGSCTAVRDLKALRFSILKDRLFVLHAVNDPHWRGDPTERFVISEFTWESSRSDLRKLNDYDVPLTGLAERHADIFTSTGLMLSTWVHPFQPEYGSVLQLIKIYDVSAGRWRDLPPLIGDPGIRIDSFVSSERLFMCELRWDADP